jgi:hypothetical protein
MFFCCLFTLCSAHIKDLVIVMSDSTCGRIGKWKTCLILNEGNYDENCHIIRGIDSKFLRICRYIRIMGRQY